MIRRDIQVVLERWGNWSRCKIGTEYRHESSFMTGTPQALSYNPTCTDDEAMKVDRAVASLARYDLLGYKLIISYYVYKVSKAKLAKTLKKDRKQVISFINRAEDYVAGALQFQVC